MADENQLKLLLQGVNGWNKWRNENEETKVDLSGANLQEINLSRANLRKANLEGANLQEAILMQAHLEGANLRKANLQEAILMQAHLEGAILYDATLSGARLEEANLWGAHLEGAHLQEAHLEGATLGGAHLWGARLQEAHLEGANLWGARLQEAHLEGANLEGANLQEAHLEGANLQEAHLQRVTLRGADCYRTNFSYADLTGANMQNAILVETNLKQVVITNCKIYGLSAWNLKGTPANQSSLVITPDGEAEITVDDLQVAQFVYLLLNNQNVRNVINTITAKAVLILGRFTPERKAVLDAMAAELRMHNLLPIIFDFERSPSRDFTETIKPLASLSFCVIADITNPSSAPLELQATVPDFQIPFVSIIQAGEKPFSMFSNLIGKYDWVLKPVITYSSIDNLLAGFKPAILDRAWEKHQELKLRKAQETEVSSMDDFLKKSN